MRVELSRDGGETFETLADVAANTGSFAWLGHRSGQRRRARARDERPDRMVASVAWAPSRSSRRRWR